MISVKVSIIIGVISVAVGVACSYLPRVVVGCIISMLLTWTIRSIYYDFH